MKRLKEILQPGKNRKNDQQVSEIKPKNRNPFTTRKPEDPRGNDDYGRPGTPIRDKLAELRKKTPKSELPILHEEEDPGPFSTLIIILKICLYKRVLALFFGRENRQNDVF